MNIRSWFLPVLLLLVFVGNGLSKDRKDVIKTSEGKIKIELLGHASLKLQYQGMTLYCDPVFAGQKRRNLPKADLICITHSHYDHFNINSISEISDAKTKLVYSQSCSQKLPGGIVIENYESTNIKGIDIKAFPAYNTGTKFNESSPYHPKGVGNGYIIKIDNIIIYIAGDTDLIPEMSELPEIDIAFLPIMAPYTMGKEMFIEAVRIIQPKKVYPYHTGVTNLDNLDELLKPESTIEVCIK